MSALQVASPPRPGSLFSGAPKFCAPSENRPLPFRAVAQFFSRLKKRRPFFFDLNRLAAAGITACAGLAVFHRKCAEAAQFHAVAVRQGLRHFVKNNGHDFFDVPVKQIWIFVRKNLDKFGFYHVPLDQPQSLARRPLRTNSIANCDFSAHYMKICANSVAYTVKRLMRRQGRFFIFPPFDRPTAWAK